MYIEIEFNPYSDLPELYYEFVNNLKKYASYPAYCDDVHDILRDFVLELV